MQCPKMQQFVVMERNPVNNAIAIDYFKPQRTNNKPSWYLLDDKYMKMSQMSQKS